MISNKHCKIYHTADAASLGRMAGTHAAAVIKKAIAEKGTANIILATGTSQFETLNQLIAEPGIDWGKVTMFHLDEYIGLPITANASFRKYLKERFLDKVSALAVAHLINGENDPVVECVRLNNILSKQTIDVALVGIGENGHLAFNDPPADFEVTDPYIIVQLDEACRKQQFNEGWFSTMEQVPKQAISMSIQQIMKATEIICSVPDIRKAAAVRNCLKESISNLFPASILQGHAKCSIYLDKAAASLLGKKVDSQVNSLSKKQTMISIGIIGILFFIFGFVSWVNAILIPYFKIACELTHFKAYLVTFAFYISYFVMSIPASYVLKRTGFKKGMMTGFWIMALGAFIFVPAALTRTYEIFLIGLFTIGTGLAFLQTAANPYITVLGPKESAAQRISIMGIFNKGAGILAPLVFAAVILKATDTDLFAQLSGMGLSEKAKALDELVKRVIVPYVFVGMVLLALGFLVRYAPLPEIDTEHESEELATANMGKKNILAFPHLILGAIGIFLHVGTQVIAIDTIIGYANSMQIPLMEAKVFPSYTLAATICGYILGIITIPKYISQVTALRFCTLLGTLLTLLIVFSKGEVSFLNHTADISIWFVVLLGFANSLVWAGIWPLALDGLGKFTKLGASVMIMGLCGNALLPLLYGYLADMFTVRLAYWVLLPCYLYLVFYAIYGHRIRRWST